MKARKSSSVIRLSTFFCAREKEKNHAFWYQSKRHLPNFIPSIVELMFWKFLELCNQNESYKHYCCRILPCPKTHVFQIKGNERSVSCFKYLYNTLIDICNYLYRLPSYRRTDFWCFFHYFHSKICNWLRMSVSFVRYTTNHHVSITNRLNLQIALTIIHVSFDFQGHTTCLYKVTFFQETLSQNGRNWPNKNCMRSTFDLIVIRSLCLSIFFKFVTFFLFHVCQSKGHVF